MTGAIILGLLFILTTAVDYYLTHNKKAKLINKLITNNKMLNAQVNSLIEGDKFIFVKLNEGVKTSRKDIRKLRARLKPFTDEDYKVLVTYDEMSLRSNREIT